MPKKIYSKHQITAFIKALPWVVYGALFWVVFLLVWCGPKD